MTDRASIAWERRRALAFALHESHARTRAHIRALRNEASACHASVVAFDAKLDKLTSSPLRDQLRACSQRLDRAVSAFIAGRVTG
jgi:hypothetical protein